MTLHIFERDWKKTSPRTEFGGILVNSNSPISEQKAAALKGSALDKSEFLPSENMRIYFLGHEIIDSPLFTRDSTRGEVYLDSRVLKDFPIEIGENLRNLDIISVREDRTSLSVITPVEAILVEGYSRDLNRFEIVKDDSGERRIFKKRTKTFGKRVMSIDQFNEELKRQAFLYIQYYKRLPFCGNLVANHLRKFDRIIVEEDDPKNINQLR